MNFSSHKLQKSKRSYLGSTGQPNPKVNTLFQSRNQGVGGKIHLSQNQRVKVKDRKKNKSKFYGNGLRIDTPQKGEVSKRKSFADSWKHSPTGVTGYARIKVPSKSPMFLSKNYGHPTTD